MKSPYFFFGLLLLGLAFMAGCRSEFETVRLSNDPELIFKKAMEYYEEEEWYNSQVLIEQAIPYYRGRPESELMFYRYAQTFYKLKNYLLANHWFQNFSNTYPNSTYRQESDWLVAYSNYLLSPSFRLDQGVSDQSVEDFQLFVNTYPNSPRVQECNELIDELRAKREVKSFEEGLLYYKMERYQAAMQSMKNTLADYPETPRRKELSLYIVLSQFYLAENSKYSKKKERYLKSIELAEEFIDKFPDAEESAEAERIIRKSQVQLKQIKDV